MTMYRRRLLCFALALSMLITLIPAATGSRISAYAENVRMGITLDKVNLRYGAGTDQKIAFELPANHVCEILGTKRHRRFIGSKSGLPIRPVKTAIPIPVISMAISCVN